MHTRRRQKEQERYTEEHGWRREKKVRERRGRIKSARQNCQRPEIKMVHLQDLA